MANSSSFAYSKEAAKKNFISFYELLSIVLNYISPRGDKKLRLRLIGLIVALILSKICAALIPIFYGAAVDALAPLNIEAGISFSMGLLMILIGGYAIARVGETIEQLWKQIL